MIVHYSNGLGQICDKDSKQPIAQVNYRLIEIDPIKYTKKNWWGEFYISKELKESVIFSRDGDCAVWTNSKAQESSSAKQFNYHFNGRSKLGRDFSGSTS